MFVGRALLPTTLLVLAVNIWQPLGIHTDRKLTRTPLPPIGRIRLSDIAGEWSRTQALNPLLLAAEVAGVLRTLVPDDQPLGHQHYSLAMFDLSTGAGGITYWALADYFDALSSGQPSDCIDTTIGSIRVGTVLLAHTFFSPIVVEAIKRAATAAGFIVEALQDPATIGSAQRQIFQPEPPPGSSPEVLTAHQTQQRQQGESSASERLEAAELRALALEQENTKLRAQLAILESHHQQAIDDSEEHRRTASDERRKRTLSEEHRRELAEALEIAEAKTATAEARFEQAVRALPALSQQLIEVAQLFRPPTVTTNKPLDPRERVSFERLVYALAHEAGYRLEKPYADADLIIRYADTIGAKVPTGKGLIAKKLEAAAARFAKDQEE